MEPDPQHFRPWQHIAMPKNTLLSLNQYQSNITLQWLTKYHNTNNIVMHEPISQYQRNAITNTNTITIPALLHAAITEAV